MKRTFVFTLIAIFLTNQAEAVSPQDCPTFTRCQTCLGAKNGQFERVCVFCATNSTCKASNEICEFEQTNPNEAIIDITKCDISEDDKKLFAVAASVICLGLLLLALLAYCFQRIQSKGKVNIEELAAFQEMEKARNKAQKDKGVELVSKKHGGDGDAKRVKQKWQVLSKGGLRVRGSPSADGEKRGILPCNAVIVTSKKRGNWVKHSQGWSMIDDGKKNGRRFLKLLDDGGLQDAAPKQTGWQCSACSAHNNVKRDACRKCGVPKVNKVDSKKKLDKGSEKKEDKQKASKKKVEQEKPRREASDSSEEEKPKKRTHKKHKKKVVEISDDDL